MSQPDQKLTDAKSDGNPITDVTSRESEIAERWEFVDGAVCDPAYEGSGFVNIPGEGSIHIPDAENARLIVDKANELLTTLTRVRGERDAAIHEKEIFRSWWAAAQQEQQQAVQRADKAEAELARVRQERDAHRRAYLEEQQVANRWYNKVLEYENREASCCPEDTPFEEVIKALRAEASRLREALRKIGHARWCQEGVRVGTKEKMVTMECSCGLYEALAASSPPAAVAEPKSEK